MRAQKLQQLWSQDQEELVGEVADMKSSVALNMARLTLLPLLTSKLLRILNPVIRRFMLALATDTANKSSAARDTEAGSLSNRNKPVDDGLRQDRHPDRLGGE